MQCVSIAFPLLITDSVMLSPICLATESAIRCMGVCVVCMSFGIVMDASAFCNLFAVVTIALGVAHMYTVMIIIVFCHATVVRMTGSRCVVLFATAASTRSSVTAFLALRMRSVVSVTDVVLDKTIALRHCDCDGCENRTIRREKKNEKP